MGTHQIEEPPENTAETVPLLNSEEVATFVNQGYLRFDEIVPKVLCRDNLDFLTGPSGSFASYEGNRTISQSWLGTPLASVFSIPKIKGIAESLVGKEPWVDGQHMHVTPAHSQGGGLHQDYERKPFRYRFRVLLSFFFHDTPYDMGGTAFLPGSHLRRMDRYLNPTRYHHITGMLPCVCKAGTMFIWHWSVWHKARSNHTDRPRYMYKVFLHPRVRQRLTWDISNLDDPEIARILICSQPWFGGEDRLEALKRIELWRYLTGDRKGRVAWQPLDQYPNDVEYDEL